MIRILAFTCFVALLAGCNSGAPSTQQSSSDDAPFMYFTEEEHNFGAVTEGQQLEHTFVVQNKGKGDLLIANVRTSCGCTVATFEKSPIPAGKSGKIKLHLDTNGKNGKVRKTATIISNAIPETKDLVLSCEVSSK
jgi:hypothetical protein